MSTQKYLWGSVIGCTIIVILFIGMSSISFGADYKTPHTFKPGDIISADMMNELFGYIQAAERTLTTADLVGTWKCDGIANPIWADHLPEDLAPGWVKGQDGLTLNISNVTLQIIDDGDGTYSYSTSDHFFSCATYMTTSGPILVKNRSMFLGLPRTDDMKLYQLMFNRSGEGQFSIVKPFGGVISHILACGNCSKQNVPPDKPTNLSVTTSGLTVSLSWTDNSTDETGFKVVRKDHLTGTYAEVATTSANTNSYSDTVPEAGKYWYRVNATNGNGDSLGSNVVMVKVAK